MLPGFLFLDISTHDICRLFKIREEWEVYLQFMAFAWQDIIVLVSVMKYGDNTDNTKLLLSKKTFVMLLNAC